MKARGEGEGAPMMNESPTLTEGTRPSEPTRAAAPSLRA